MTGQHRSSTTIGVSSIAGTSAIPLLMLVGLVAQGCSSSRGFDEPGYNSYRSWGGDRSAYQSNVGRPPSPPQSAYATDGPAPVYRGGRDPVTGRAPSWSPSSAPAATPPARSAAVNDAYRPDANPPAYRDAPPPYREDYRLAPTAAAQSYRPAPQTYERQAAPDSRGPATTGVIEIKPGDTLYRISRIYGVPIESLMRVNGLTSEAVRPGQRIAIPAY